MGRWWFAVPRSSWPETHVETILADCEGPWGDRRQELVFIGVALPEAAIRAAFDACLATDAEMARLCTPCTPIGTPVAGRGTADRAVRVGRSKGSVVWERQ